MALAVIALMLGVVACGGSNGPPNDELRQAVARGLLCNPPGIALELHHSGLNCQEAGATLVLLASGVEGPQVVEGARGGPWTCRDLSRDGRPYFVKCTHGERYFTAVGAPR